MWLLLFLLFFLLSSVLHQILCSDCFYLLLQHDISVFVCWVCCFLRFCLVENQIKKLLASGFCWSPASWWGLLENGAITPWGVSATRSLSSPCLGSRNQSDNLSREIQLLARESVKPRQKLNKAAKSCFFLVVCLAIMNDCVCVCPYSLGCCNVLEWFAIVQMEKLLQLEAANLQFVAQTGTEEVVQQKQHTLQVFWWCQAMWWLVERCCKGFFEEGGKEGEDEMD